jgi:subtilase family serine protease
MHTRVELQMRLPLLILVALLCIMLLQLSPFSSRTSAPLGTKFATTLGGRPFKAWKGATAPTDAQCRAMFRAPCYSPHELQRAYSLDPLLDKGINGKGQTIIIIDSFGSPTAWSDLKKFDKDYGLPNPPSFKVLAPLGSVPFDANNPDQSGWAQETSLDVQWSHAMAPGANIILMTSPVSETEGVQGLPEFLALEKYALDHHLGKIITQSWSATENTLFTPAGEEVIQDFEAFYKRAADEHVSIFASAGDSGSVNQDVAGNNYPFPTVGYPASSPWVTAVGGTSLFADTQGNYQSETVWNDGPGDATGGGISQYFKEPSYQKHLSAANQALLNGYRGLPDISYNADPNTAVPVYLGFLGSQSNYYLFGGTSEGSPQWAGIIADANQYAGHALGFLNPALYQLGKSGEEHPEVYHDITLGNNSQGSIPGYKATVGWDPVTGWGTPVIDKLIEELA